MIFSRLFQSCSVRRSRICESQYQVQASSSCTDLVAATVCLKSLSSVILKIALSSAGLICPSGELRQNLSHESPLEIQINAMVNVGDSADYKLRHRICDWVEGMHQAPDWDDKDSCPPHEGPLLMHYEMWFAPFLVAPVSHSRPDLWQVLEVIDHPLGALERQVRRKNAGRRSHLLLADAVRPSMPSGVRCTRMSTGLYACLSASANTST